MLNRHMDEIIRESQLSGRVLGIRASYTPRRDPKTGEQFVSYGEFTGGGCRTLELTLEPRVRGIVPMTSLPGVAMPSISTALSDCLRSVERPGDFCVGGLREVFMPAIDVDGVGQIAFPLLPVQVERLVAIAEAAPYGRGEETVVDRDVRRTWQIEPGKVRIDGRHWAKTLAELVADAALGLGVDESVAAEFYKLLVYDTGSFFVGHRDTEKVPGMFATMVLVLPSTHTGGELIIK